VDWKGTMNAFSLRILTSFSDNTIIKQDLKHNQNVSSSLLGCYLFH
jgi:hypothetical protein